MESSIRTEQPSPTDSSIYRHIKIIRLDPEEQPRRRFRRHITEPELPDKQALQQQLSADEEIDRLVQKYSQQVVIRRAPEVQEDRKLMELRRIRKNYSDQIREVQHQIISIFQNQTTSEGYKQTKRMTRMRDPLPAASSLKNVNKYNNFYENLWKGTSPKEHCGDMAMEVDRAEREIRENKVHHNFISFLKERKIRVPRLIQNIQNSEHSS